MSETLQWSVYFQNPEFLERTRMFLISEEYIPLVQRWCGVKNGTSLLDVGCGTGYFSRLLTKGMDDVRTVGIDREEIFIEYAKQYVKKHGLNHIYNKADALNMPYEDGEFDVVVSHTFLTSINDPHAAVSEMKRVARPGGTIASITSATFLQPLLSLGTYPVDCEWIAEFYELSDIVNSMYFKIDPISNRILGLRTSEIPHFFSKEGLKDVRAYPIGKLFSLSNSAIKEREKLKWIELYEISETKKLKAYRELKESSKYVTEEQFDRYEELIHEKANWWKRNLNDNMVWDWQAGVNILVCGTK